MFEWGTLFAPRVWFTGGGPHAARKSARCFFFMLAFLLYPLIKCVFYM